MEYVDSYLSVTWNKTNVSEQIIEENLWDFCRLFEEKGLLVGDDASISAISIGPFRIASTVELKKKDMLVNFLEITVPAIFSKVNALTFEQAYSLYLLPIALLFINLSEQCCFIKDTLQWEVLMFIKRQNQNNIYPTVGEICKSADFKGVEIWQISDCIEELGCFKNIFGDKNCLVQVDMEGRIKCLV